MSIIIGIDPGLKATGYGVLDVSGGIVTYHTHGVITTKPNEAIGERLVRIFNRLTEVIREAAPDEAGVESLFMARNQKSAIPVAQARGVILLALASQRIPVSEYTPLEVKLSVVGKGRAEKGQVQHMVRLILGMQKIPEPCHAADALAVALCHSSRRAVLKRFEAGF
ncbi:MAG: crossover junction endodeoxyribonuclease RuvC [Spirochaetales bacterium]|nr:crossover junction endodeoxyribonuclease RuvC [Spirochaetales bacterium]